MAHLFYKKVIELFLVNIMNNSNIFWRTGFTDRLKDTHPSITLKDLIISMKIKILKMNSKYISEGNVRTADQGKKQLIQEGLWKRN